MIKLTTPLVVLLSVLAVPLAVAADDFATIEKTWRDKRHARLASESGWLTLVGLHWLQPGDNAFGSDPSNPVPLPEGKAPKQAGVLTLDKGRVHLKAASGSGLTIDGKPIVEKDLGDDTSDTTDVMEIGDLSFYVIKRDDRVGIRVKDKNSPVRTSFKGIDYFPADPKWMVNGTFVPYDAPKKVAVPTVLGTTDTMEAPGLVTFTIDGKELSLQPVVEDPTHPMLWFIFKDGTSAKETYGGGRFLYAEMPKNGRVVVDFNQAYNPPCAFTPYATCPLPPKENWLPIRVEAGEKAYAEGHHAP
jgi:uncharacterized protein (DUF1684 family)